MSRSFTPCTTVPLASVPNFAGNVPDACFAEGQRPPRRGEHYVFFDVRSGAEIRDALIARFGKTSFHGPEMNGRFWSFARSLLGCPGVGALAADWHGFCPPLESLAHAVHLSCCRR